MSRIRQQKATALILVMLLLQLMALPAKAEPWKFGIMGDTQWTTADPTGANPNTVPVTIIDQVNREFIREGVRFVIAVGDLSDDGKEISETTRARTAQALIDAGIGFFPFRGNHELKGGEDFGLSVFRSNYPQTTTGLFTTSSNHRFRVGRQFSSPVSVSSGLAGLSYSFDYGDRASNSRFVIIDPWPLPGKVVESPTGYPNGFTIHDQQPWISKRLDRKSGGVKHVFVFAHQPLIAEGHQDTMFGGYADAHPDWQNEFYASMQQNGARFFISGHDHLHQRSIVLSPDGKSRVEEVIAASCSTKFYTPKSIDDPKWFGQKSREIPISQERGSVGYSIWTVDGPLVRVNYYADDHGNWQSDAAYPNGTGRSDTGVTPTFRFVKTESWSYSLNGREFLVRQGESYTVVNDHYRGTTARILDGANLSTAREGYPKNPAATGRPLAKTVDTGWITRKGRHLASDILCLDGMGDPGSGKSDLFVLSMSYDPSLVIAGNLLNGSFGLASVDESGHTGNAVGPISNTDRRFIAGPWVKGYPAGTWGVDVRSRTVWAVIDHTGRFAAAVFDR